MKRLSSLKAACTVLVFCAATATLSLAQDTLTTLVSFDGLNGSDPYMVLTQGADGNFYGTTNGGGPFQRHGFQNDPGRHADEVIRFLLADELRRWI